MASLYLARRRGAASFTRLVAIKVVHPHLAADPAFLRMFVREAQLAARIDHPNVVRVEELGSHAGSYFMAMELVRGWSLAELLEALAHADQVLEPAEVVYLAIQIAEGLHAAHETCGEDDEPLNVVHRDVSPQNVLVSEAGHVKVIDFGIAKARGSGHTTTNTLKGKYAYMAPEQARGEALDKRADVYALGVLAWELLTGQLLFHRETDAAVLDAVRAPEVQPPSAVRARADIPPALDDAMMRALRPDPESRFASAEAFAVALAAAVPQTAAVNARTIRQRLTGLRSVLPRRTFTPAKDDKGPHTSQQSQATETTPVRGLNVHTTKPPRPARQPQATSRSPRNVRRVALTLVIAAGLALTGGAVAWPDDRSEPTAPKLREVPTSAPTPDLIPAQDDAPARLPFQEAEVETTLTHRTLEDRRAHSLRVLRAQTRAPARALRPDGPEVLKRAGSAPRESERVIPIKKKAAPPPRKPKAKRGKPDFTLIDGVPVADGPGY